MVGRLTQERKAPSAALYFGKGKVEEIKTLSRRERADLMISDDPLSPIQERNLGGSLGLRVIDRTALILDIFAQRARTMEGKLQVELAQLSYLLPRLVGQWKHLERLGGGIGTRGPGETQIESDRRMIRHRIRKITEELKRVRVHRRLLRDRRKASGVPVVALVGYTNAGKTTLLNRLTGASRTAADQLFVTLDPTARLVSSSPHASFVLTDTVGFIRKLPHQLVAAFKATLEELAEADVLLHVVDASHPALDDQMAAVEQLLGELELTERPTIVVLNKADRLEAEVSLAGLVERFQRRRRVRAHGRGDRGAARPHRRGAAPRRRARDAAHPVRRRAGARPVLRARPRARPLRRGRRHPPRGRAAAAPARAARGVPGDGLIDRRGQFPAACPIAGATIGSLPAESWDSPTGSRRCAFC